MIYVDSCIPMYLVGGDHPLKSRTIELVSSLISSGEELVTSAEVFQEIIHRYVAIRKKKDLRICYSALEEMVTQVFEVGKVHTDLALRFLAEYDKLSSRDLLHLGVMKEYGCVKIWTYDSGFDQVDGITRIS